MTEHKITKIQLNIITGKPQTNTKVSLIYWQEF